MVLPHTAWYAAPGVRGGGDTITPWPEADERTLASARRMTAAVDCISAGSGTTDDSIREGAWGRAQLE